MTNQTTPTVRPGQIWTDNDKRATGRKVRVISLTADSRAEVVRCDYRGQQLGTRITYIQLDRFRPTSTGYRLAQDVQP